MISASPNYVFDILSYFDLRCRLIRRHFALLLIVLAIGTCFYSVAEDLNVLDAAYFSTITLATVGYGDIAPQTTLGRAFTGVYLLLGVVTHISFATSVVAHRQRRGCGCPPLAEEDDRRDGQPRLRLVRPERLDESRAG